MYKLLSALCLLSFAYAEVDDFALIEGGIVEHFINPEPVEQEIVEQTEPVIEAPKPLLEPPQEEIVFKESKPPSPFFAQSSAPPLELEIDDEHYIDPEKRWYFSFKPAYYYFSDPDMRKTFDDGGFTFRVETGYKFWWPLMVWLDAGYFQKKGVALGGTEHTELKLGTLTLGLKWIYDYSPNVAFYAGAGPRLFMVLMHNQSPYVRSDDNEVGLGGGFDVGVWVFPVPSCSRFFIDVFADYSWKKVHMQEDEISSFDTDVNVSGLSFGAGLGVKF